MSFAAARLSRRPSLVLEWRDATDLCRIGAPRGAVRRVSPPREASASLPKDVRALEVARRFVAEQLIGQPADAVIDAQLLASEFVTAIILCGRRPRDVTVSVDDAAGTVRVAVGDGAAKRGERASPLVLEPLGESIVRRVSARWGADIDEAGNVRLWSEMRGGFEKPDVP